ncbi:MAG TPA: hypothetical protein DCM62_07920 [Bacteroidales bacterium]|nr:hypothetical protein [Bacteroidales bacterium]
MKLNEIARQIVKLRWDSNYSQALEMYKEQVHGHFAQEQIVAHQALLNCIIDCLKKTEKLKEAIAMIENVWQIVPDQISDKNLQRNVAWTYFFGLAPNNIQFEHNKKRTLQLKWLVSNLLLNNEQQLAGMILFRYTDWLMMQKPPLMEDVDHILQSVDPQQLSHQCRIVQTTIKGHIKDIELASDQEKWFMLSTKILYSQAKYDECIDACNRAFGMVQKFHQGNQIWISRRLALSMKQKGMGAKAIEMMETIYQKKKDWFIEKELAELFFENRQSHKAMQMAILACEKGGYSEYKVGLFELVGDIFHATKKMEQAACQAYTLAAMVRNTQNWKLTEKLREKLESCQDFTAQGLTDYYQACIVHWKKLVYGDNASPTTQSTQVHKGIGKVTRVLNTGSNGDGFITDEQGRGIYFRFNKCQIANELICEGLAVKFHAIEIDRKGKKVWNAIKVFEKNAQGKSK